MTSSTRLPFGTALALAQRTLAAPLTAVLQAERVSPPEWFALNALGLRGPSPVAALAALLATNGLDAAAVDGLLAGLARSGTVELHDGAAGLTPAGAARYAELRDRIGAVTTRIFAQFDPDRVETARGLLEEIAALDPDELTRRTVAR
ncbi:MarR family winged helix-turn-helix transcriptional regulator [Dactylosporangium sp. McL0621]|uniref:MarR family winged helix-turn-helix transcriptional regulator n=1 Tax=Dactylosporangium sp. McL0621 TaxID=3415678 RepID=UPI003CED2D99